MAFMQKNNSKSLWNIVIYFSANIINAAIPFALLPVLTRVLTPNDYGQASMYMLYLTFIGAFVGCSIHGSISVKYYELNKIEFSSYVTSCLIFLLMSCGFSLLAVFVFSELLFILFSVPEKWLYIGIFTAFFQFLINIRLAIWLVAERPYKYGFFQVVNTLISGVLSILLIIYVFISWEGHALGQSVSIGLFGLIALSSIYFSGYIIKPIRIWSDIQVALKFGVPLIFHTLGSILIYSVARLIIINTMGLEVVGIYVVAIQFGQAMNLVSTAFNRVYAPWLMRNLSNNSIDKVAVVKISYLSMLIILFLGVFWGITAYILLPYIVSAEFMEAKRIVIYTSMAFSVTGCYYVVTNYIFYSLRTTFLTFITMSCGAINIPLTYTLVSFLGLEGAALAFLIVQVLFFVLTWIAANRVYPMPWFFYLKK